MNIIVRNIFNHIFKFCSYYFDQHYIYINNHELISCLLIKDTKLLVTINNLRAIVGQIEDFRIDLHRDSMNGYRVNYGKRRIRCVDETNCPL